MKTKKHLIKPSPSQITVGIDEAGRGCWAGPVVASAVVWGKDIPGLNDSKKLSPESRQLLVPTIKKNARAYGIGVASAKEIDTLNILQATYLAMTRALEAIDTQLFNGGLILVDGNRLPVWEKIGWTMESIIKGDASHSVIAAASILAKEYRDELMNQLDILYPVYGFSKHKSYGTSEHLKALREHGPCPEHRFSFRPIKNLKPLSEPVTQEAS